MRWAPARTPAAVCSGRSHVGKATLMRTFTRARTRTRTHRRGNRREHFAQRPRKTSACCMRARTHAHAQTSLRNEARRIAEDEIVYVRVLDRKAAIVPDCSARAREHADDHQSPGPSQRKPGHAERARRPRKDTRDRRRVSAPPAQPPPAPTSC